VISRLSQPDAADLLLVDDGSNLGALREEASALRARRAELADLFADGVITGAQLARGTDRAREALQAVEENWRTPARYPLSVTSSRPVTFNDHYWRVFRGLLTVGTARAIPEP
jgi:hypothetical protein